MKKKPKKNVKKKAAAKKKKPAKAKKRPAPRKKAPARPKKAARKKQAKPKKRAAARHKPFRRPPAPPAKPAEKPAKFTPEDLASIRAALEAKRQELYDAYLQTKRMSFDQGGSDGTHDSGDIASSTYTREFLLTLNDSEQRLLKQIDEALDRLDRRKYGLCASCRSPIAAKRLRWIPWATLCMACQSGNETA